MNGHDKRRQRKERAILEAAESLFSKHGIEPVSMDDIASHSNVAKMTLYKYFNSKQGLVAELIRSEYETAIMKAEDILDGSAQFHEKLTEIINLKASVISKYGADFVFAAFSSNNSLQVYRDQDLGPRIDQLLKKFFEEGKVKGFINPDYSERAFRAYLDVFADGLSKPNSELSKILDHSETRGQIIELFFFGIAGRKSP